MWWDVLGWSKTIVIPIIPDDIVDLFRCAEYVCSRPFEIACPNADDVQSNVLELLSVFLTEKQLDRLRLTISTEPSGFEACRRYWTLSKHAASAFREGQIHLEPDWNTERRPDEDLKSKCYVRTEFLVIFGCYAH